MYLNEISKKVLRDGEFDYLGIIDSTTTHPILTFIDSEKYMDALLSKKHIRCVITNEQLGKHLLEVSNLGVCISDNPRISFFKLHNALGKTDTYSRPSFQTEINENCQISKLACIADHNVTIGKNVIIEEFVSIKENTVVGDNCIIRAGSIIGGSGFEFKYEANTILAVQHYGGVIIENNVEIKYNSILDKAVYPWDNTIIGAYTKIDNLIHIAHAVKIGKNVLIPAGTTVGGRVEIADNVWIGVGSVILNGIHFGEGSRCNIGSVVTKDVPAGESVSGNFAINHDKFIEQLKKVR